MRRILVITCLITTSIIGSAQSPEEIKEQIIKKDSLFVDSLLKILPLKQDTTRISMLNKVADAFLNSNYTPFKTKADSVTKYALTAFNEAKHRNYTYGLAQSLLNLVNASNLLFYFNRSSKIDNRANLQNWEQYQTQLLDLCPKLKDAETCAKAYYSLASLLEKQDKKQECLKAKITALQWFEKAGDEQYQAELCDELFFAFYDRGEFEKALDYGNKALQLAKKINQNAGPADFSNALVQQTLLSMSELYKTAGDYQTALSFLRDGREFHFQHKAINTWGMEPELGDIFLLLGETDSAYSYIQPYVNVKNIAFASNMWPRMGDVYFLTGSYDSALYYYDKAIDTMKPRAMIEGPQYALMRSYFGKAKIYAERKNYKTALVYARESYRYASLRSSIDYILNINNLLSQLFHKTHNNDSAYIYSRRYIELKDSVLNRQFYFRLNSYKKASEDEKRVGQIQLLNKENQLNQSKLKQQAIVRNSLAIGLVLLIIAGAFLIRSLHFKRKNEMLLRRHVESKLKIQQLQSVELEMQALRAQMNPHFIFNCLSSINSFILKHEAKTASSYLARFSRLMRMVLQNSQKEIVTLEDELQMLRLYLEMERLRFKDSFDYAITFLNEMDVDNIFIPPLILQPFCENAIWHGLMHKGDRGLLSIELMMKEGVLVCIITDNGVGRENAEALKSKTAEKKKSLGLQITEGRLALLNRNKQIALYEIEDMKDGNGIALGTRVTIRISIETLTGKPVSISQE
ncbi:MAG: tetratricopeptide repeat-containing sensor histidine kinase [Flavisolibacter sp.]